MQPNLGVTQQENSIKIVAIGGGTGLSTLLRGLKLYTKEITAIVTVADDGGSTGMLRRDLDMAAPGDIRNCLQALANCEPMMAQLMAYRFSDGSLKGQSLGNMLLAALNDMEPTFDKAVENLSRVLAITGRVLPVTNANVQLEATFENGVSVLGESHIAYCKKEQDCRIRSVRLLPEHPVALNAAIEAIQKADMVILSSGSLYTSIIPNLLVDGISEAIAASRAVKVYVCNIMTQEGETEGYTAADHIRALFKHSVPNLFDLSLVNDTPIPPEVAERYAVEGAAPIVYDEDGCAALGVQLIKRGVATFENDYVRHDSVQLAQELLKLYHDYTEK